MDAHRPTGWPWSFEPGALDASVTAEFVPLRTTDHADALSVVYFPAGTRPKTFFLVVHPRLDFTRFYATPAVTAAGFGIMCLTTRFLNNDSDAQHERMLFDIAAGMRHLRGRGVEDVVLIGNSGGGSLTSFYQAQATLAPEARLDRTPSGERVPLASEDMPLATGQVQVAVHIGEGDFMSRVIDPAVLDEADPTMSDADLDMYDERNGRRPYPEPSSYDPTWLARYRDAQLRRTQRLDSIALALVRDKLDLRAKLGPEVLASSATIRRFRMQARYMTVYRTLANPFYLDPAIDPSGRALGSCVVPRQDPIIGNYALFGFARSVSPRAWLSNWSATMTQTSMTINLPRYDVPSLFAHATGDTEAGSAEFAEVLEATAATDRTVIAVDGDHYLRPLSSDAPSPRAQFLESVNEWATTRFPV